jgi:F0F1-type ATP synthase membrane subunit b/b'
MKVISAGSLLLLACSALCLDAQQTGVSTDWDVGKTLAAISAHASRLESLLDQIQPQEWVSKGAPEQYVTQWKESRTQIQAIVASAKDLSRNPGKLTDSLQLLFRVQSLEVMLGSLREGIRKYHNPAVADLLNGVVAENGANRNRLQQYVLDLAAEKEQEFTVADREAQRCREFLSKQPAPAHRPERK